MITGNKKNQKLRTLTSITFQIWSDWKTWWPNRLTELLTQLTMSQLFMNFLKSEIYFVKFLMTRKVSNLFKKDLKLLRTKTNILFKIHKCSMKIILLIKLKLTLKIMQKMKLLKLKPNIRKLRLKIWKIGWIFQSIKIQMAKY